MYTGVLGEAPENPLTAMLGRKKLPRGTRRIVRAMSTRGPMSASELADHTGLAKSTISTVVAGLRDVGIVVDEHGGPTAPKGVGRPSTPLALNPELGTCVGVHLGYETVSIMVADVAHKVIKTCVEPVAPGYSAKRGADIAKRLIDRIYEDQGLPKGRLLGVGVSVAGPVARDGMIMHSSILPEMAGSNVLKEFRDVLNVPILAANESNCAAIGEMTWGAAVGEPSFVLFKIDLGVGGAIVQNGEIVKGVAGGGGEFGHVSIDSSGALCRCGNRGCMETSASLKAPMEKLARLKGREISIEDAVDLAKAGDVDATEIFLDVAKAAGRGLAVVATILNPPVVVLSGRFALAGSLVMKPFLEAYEDSVLIKPRDIRPEDQTRIVVGHFTGEDSLRGAFGLVLREIGAVSVAAP